MQLPYILLSDIGIYGSVAGLTVGDATLREYM